MKSEWTKKKLSDIADFNPRETIKKGAIAKKIPMDLLRSFYRDISYYVEECFLVVRSSVMEIQLWHELRRV